VDVRLVNVTATVTDESGKYINNLTADDFVLEEDGIAQKITHFKQDYAVPVSVGILLDTSGSMIHKIQTATDAVDRFARNIHRDDDIFLMTFAAKPTLRQDFTSDRQKISRSLREIRPLRGEFNVLEIITAMYDSLNAAIDKVATGRHSKRAILLFSDGRDTWSKVKLDELTRLIGRSEVLVYSLGVDGTEQRDDSNLPSVGVNMKTLQQFADSSGGRAILLSGYKSSHFDAVLSDIATELRSQYSLGYYPTHSDDGGFHTIKVKTRQGHNARARNGYW
jgi:Ca-activated chloride channel family protein